MEQRQFNGVYLKQLADANNINDAKTYINKFFFHSGVGFFYFDGVEYIYHKSEDINNLMPKDIMAFRGRQLEFSGRDYLKSSEFMVRNFIPVIDYSKGKTFVKTIKTEDGEELEQHCLNMAKKPTVDKTLKRTKVTTANLKLIYDHLFNIWCSKNEELYEWVLNFIACTLAGRKLRKAIYSQCDERCGRGTIMNFLENILGKAMCKTNSVESVLKYTKAFEGCLLVNLDEMPADQGNIRSIADACKSLITEPTFTCRDMWQSSYIQKNTFNLVITANNDAIHMTQSNFQRYLCLDIDDSKKGDIKYFEPLNKATARKDVQSAFYQDMMERYETLKNWNEDIMPMSKTRMQKITESLPKLYKYLKEEYILRQKDMEILTKRFFPLYAGHTNDNTSKEKLGRMLTKLGILPIKVKKGKLQYYVYRVSHAELKEKFEKNGWIDDNVDLFEDEIKDDTDDAYLEGVDTSDKSINQNLFLKNENDRLKKELEKLKKQLGGNKLNKKPEYEELIIPKFKPLPELKILDPKYLTLPKIKPSKSIEKVSRTLGELFELPPKQQILL